MTRIVSFTRLCVVLGTLTATVGCGSTPTAPAEVSNAATIRALAVTGLPADFSVGETAQLRAQATWSDGRTEDVTSRARWHSRTLACIVTPAAVVTALETGSCSVGATFDAASATADVTIGASRTFTISGVVREQYGFREPPIPGATVTIAAGSQSGRTVTTDESGRYTLAGVPRERVVLRVEATDFESRSKDVTPDAPLLDIFLPPLTSTLFWDSRRQPEVRSLVIPFRVTHAGPATLTVFASSFTCGTYETYWAGVKPRNSDKSVLGSFACRPGIPEIVSAPLEPGEYDFIVGLLFPGADPPNYKTAELKHPR